MSRFSNLPNLPHYALHAMRVHRLPPHSAHFHRAADYGAVGDVYQLGSVVGGKTATDEYFFGRRFLYRSDFLLLSGITRSLSGGDEDIGIERLDIASELCDVTVGDNGVTAVLNVHIR